MTTSTPTTSSEEELKRALQRHGATTKEELAEPGAAWVNARIKAMLADPVRAEKYRKCQEEQARRCAEILKQAANTKS